MRFHVKKGLADPFRGDWYIHENSFSTEKEAVALALKLTFKNLREQGNRWDEDGWEWSVFSESSSQEKKIWEGFKAVSLMRTNKKTSPDEADGWLE